MGNSCSDRYVDVVHICQLGQEPDVLTDLYGDRPFKKFITSLCVVSSNKMHGRVYIKSKYSIEADRTNHLFSHPHIIHPYSVFRYYWEITMIILLLISLPSLTFLILYSSTEMVKVTIIFLCLSVIWIIDILLQFATGFFRRSSKSVVLHPTKILKQLFCHTHGTFIWDIVGSLPYELLNMFLKDVPYIRLFLILKFLKIIKLIMYMECIREKRQLSFYKWRTVEIICVLIIGISWVGCFIGLCHVIDWRTGIATDTKLNLKWISEAVSTVFTLGHVSESLCDCEFYVNFFGILFGIIVRNVLLVQIMLILKTNNYSRRKYKQLLLELHEYMKFKLLLSTTRKKVLDYYKFRYQRSYYDEDKIRKHVSDQLLREVDRFTFEKFYRNKVFTNVPINVIDILIPKLVVDVAMAGDIIYKEGSPSLAMLYINCGTVSCYLEQGTVEVLHLKEGLYISHSALLKEENLHVETFVAAEPCEIYLLKKQDFLDVVENYPGVYELVSSQIKTKRGSLENIIEGINLRGAPDPETFENRLKLLRERMLDYYNDYILFKK